MNAQLHHVSPVGLPVEATAVPATGQKRNNVPFDILVIIAVTGLLMGVTDVFGAGSFSGLCLALGAIFFGLAFIVKALRMAQEAS